jgi:alpha-ribazole phosphatase
MRLLLVSHAQTDWNVASRFQGQTDVPLNENGREQARGLQQKLASAKIAAIMASDLRRARETADIIAVPHGLTVATDARLRELHFGAWEGQTNAEIEAQNPQALTAWRKDPARLAPPGGETLYALVQRLQAFLQDWRARSVSDWSSGATLVVAHRGCLRALLCLLLEKPVERMWDFHLDIASVTELAMAGDRAEVIRISEVV